MMFSYRLVRLIESHADALAGGLEEKVNLSSQISHFRNVPAHELRERVYEIYRHLGLLRIVHVQVVDMTDDLAERIRSVSGVNAVEQQVDRLAIKLHEDQMSIEDLHDHIVGAGARIRMFQPEAMDMETAFMKLTEGKTA